MDRQKVEVGYRNRDEEAQDHSQITIKLSDLLNIMDNKTLKTRRVKCVVMARCEWCNKRCDPEEDKCAGCGAIVCVKCVVKHGHFLNEAHERPARSKPLLR